MTEARKSAAARRKQPKQAEPGSEHVDVQPDGRRWKDLLGRGIFETVIVAVGVFLALMVDEWRERSEQQQLADEARTALRAELLANREAIFQRLRLTANLYVQSAAKPQQVGQFVLERRNRQLLVNDAAWTMTVETGAIRWLEPDERRDISEIYAGHERMRDVVSQELTRWTELAEFASNSDWGGINDRRDRAIRVWRGFAQRVQLALCINLARHEIALGGEFPNAKFTGYCAERPAEEDPAITYAAWSRRGWVSPILPKALAPKAVE